MIGATEDLVGSLSSMDISAIRSTLSIRRRLNRVFDVLRLSYPDWLEAASAKDGGSRKRKKSEGGGE